jgi:phenylalanyl-tRNA synthetase beta chain
MLTRLGLILVERNNESSAWVAPSWRFDLAIEQDLVEEVARIYGYNNLPTSTPMMALELEPNAESVQGISLFRAQLVGRGYQEVISYSFVDPELQKMIEPNLVAVPLVNPISADMGVMRTSLWPGLLNTAVYNLNRQQSRVRIFEVGQCFVPGQEGASSLTQNTMLGGLLCGSRSPIGWTAGKDKVDFYDIKGDIEGLTGLTGLQHTFSFNAAVHPALHPGQCAQLTRNGEAIGWVGQLHPRIKSSVGIDSDVYLFQIDADKISEVRIPIHEEVSKFPEVKRDLAFFVEASIGAQTLIDHAKNVAGELLVGLKLFDVYQSKDVENKGKSIALGLTFQHSSRTLTDEEVSQAIDRVVSELAAECKAELRA